MGARYRQRFFDHTSENPDGDSGLVVAPARRWQPRLVTITLWGLIGLAVVLSAASFAAAQTPPSPAKPAEATIPPPAVAGVAERVVTSWMSASPEPAIAAQLVDPGSYGQRALQGFTVVRAAAVQIEPVDVDYWAVTVAVTVEVAPAQAETSPAGVELFVQVGVADTGRGLVAVTGPAPVPVPGAPTGVEVAARQMAGVDGQDPQIATAVSFVTALLTGDQAVDRYSAPDLHVTPAVAAGVFVDVEPVRASSTPTETGTLIRLEVLAQSASGSEILFAYTVTVVDRDGRSEITTFGATPPLANSAPAETEPDPSAPTTNSSQTFDQPSAPSIQTTPTPSSSTSPPPANIGGLNGPYDTVDRPGA